MGAGVTLMVVGAILAFAVRRETPGVDVQTVGVILLLAGLAVVAHARRGARHEHAETTVEEPEDPGVPSHVVRRWVTDRDAG